MASVPTATNRCTEMRSRETSSKISVMNWRVIDQNYVKSRNEPWLHSAVLDVLDEASTLAFTYKAEQFRIGKRFEAADRK